MTQPESDPLRVLEKVQLAEPSSAVSDRILEECTRELRAERGMTKRTRLLLSLLALLIGMVTFVAARLLDGQVSEVLVQPGLYGAAGWAFMLGLLLFAGLGGAPGASPKQRLLWVLSLGGAALFFCTLGFNTQGFDSLETAMAGQGVMGCAKHTWLTGALVSGSVMLLWRGTDPFLPGLSGALLGLLGGLSSAVGVGLVCPSEEGWHLWLGHGAGVLLLMVLGSAVGRRWLAP